MILEKLHIDREAYGEKKGMLTGKVRFTDRSENAIELNLTPELNEQFMKVIGEALIVQARLVQERLIANMVDCSPTHPPDHHTEINSRSQLRRLAAMKGEPAPDF